MTDSLQGICERLVLMQVPGVGIVRLSPFRLVWRSVTVVIVTVSRTILSIHSMLGFALRTSPPLHQRRAVCFTHNWCYQHVQFLQVRMSQIECGADPCAAAWKLFQ